MPEPLQASSALSFNDWSVQNGYVDKAGEWYGTGGNINNFFTGYRDQKQADYDAYLQNLNRQFEVDKVNNARQWEEYMDSTKYQRMAEDLRKAGINPALVFANGIGAAGQPSSPSGSSDSRYHSSAQSKSGANGAQWMSSAAMVMFAIARFVALAALAG